MSDSKHDGSANEIDGDGTMPSNRDPSSGTSWDRWRPAVGFAAVVLVASLVPVPSAGGGGVGVGHGLLGTVGDVIAPTDPFHFVGYAVLAALSARATGRGGRGLVVAAAVAVAFGFGVELVQTTVPWRTFAWRDSLVNAAGATAGVLAVTTRLYALGRSPRQ